MALPLSKLSTKTRIRIGLAISILVLGFVCLKAYLGYQRTERERAFEAIRRQPLSFSFHIVDDGPESLMVNHAQDRSWVSIHPDSLIGRKDLTHIDLVDAPSVNHSMSSGYFLSGKLSPSGYTKYRRAVVTAGNKEVALLLDSGPSGIKKVPIVFPNFGDIEFVDQHVLLMYFEHRQDAEFAKHRLDLDFNMAE